MTPEQAADALRNLIRDARLARCRILSQGSGCDCGLCLVDMLTDANTARLTQMRAKIHRLTAELHEAKGRIANALL